MKLGRKLMIGIEVLVGLGVLYALGTAYKENEWINANRRQSMQAKVRQSQPRSLRLEEEIFQPTKEKTHPQKRIDYSQIEVYTPGANTEKRLTPSAPRAKPSSPLESRVESTENYNRPGTVHGEEYVSNSPLFGITGPSYTLKGIKNPDKDKIRELLSNDARRVARDLYIFRFDCDVDSLDEIAGLTTGYEPSDPVYLFTLRQQNRNWKKLNEKKLEVKTEIAPSVLISARWREGNIGEDIRKTVRIIIGTNKTTPVQTTRLGIGYYDFNSLEPKAPIPYPDF
ncbi:hypothetical protein HZA33_01645 [Candidatus Pacearchaeota archaeon]|nr:hypothetical protein [Candidatus Pacearchaeota archaeon]